MTARLDPARLEAAVSLGILTRPQADRLADFWAAPLQQTGAPTTADMAADSQDGIAHADAEEVRFARGFHDVFIHHLISVAKFAGLALF